MTKLLDGPRLPPASGQKASHLVVFLHGYGADGDDLIGLGQEWAPYLPTVAFASPHAPEPCSMSPMGRQWFPLSRRDESERLAGVESAAPALNAFLDAELARHDLTHDKLMLVGFSQGTMMALHVLPRRDQAVAGIVGVSGRLLVPELLAASRSCRLFRYSGGSRKTGRAHRNAINPADPRHP